jgi:hypothetical protein
LAELKPSGQRLSIPRGIAAGTLAICLFLVFDLLAQAFEARDHDYGCVGWTGWWTFLWDRKIERLAIWVPITFVVIRMLRISALGEGLVMGITLWWPSLANPVVVWAGGDVISTYCNLLDAASHEVVFVAQMFTPVAIIKMQHAFFRRDMGRILP